MNVAQVGERAAAGSEKGDQSCHLALEQIYFELFVMCSNTYFFFQGAIGWALQGPGQPLALAQSSK